MRTQDRDEVLQRHNNIFMQVIEFVMLQIIQSQNISVISQTEHDERNFIDRMLFKIANPVCTQSFHVNIRNKSFTLTVNPICTCKFICNCMFELLYFNQFSSFIVQLRSVNCFLQNKLNEMIIQRGEADSEDSSALTVCAQWSG